MLPFKIPASYLLGAMDPTASPCHDFFQFACGSWNRKHVIPEDRSSISTFEVMADQLQIILKGQKMCGARRIQIPFPFRKVSREIKIDGN